MGIEFEPDDILGSLDSELPEEAGALSVETLGGVIMAVQNRQEKAFYENIAKRYRAQYTMEDPSDIADMDRILTMELLVYRYSQMLGRGEDSSGLSMGPRDTATIQKALTDTSVQLGKVKDAMGLSRSARDAAAADDVASYLTQLLQRAKAFGIHRNDQANMGIALTKEVISVAGTWLRSNDMERSKTKFRTAEDVLQWIVDEVKPQMDQVDKDFRSSKQINWVGQI
jgi:hypothetical protein